MISKGTDKYYYYSVYFSFQALMTLCLCLGIKKATLTVIAHPALVLTPTFSFWTFGPRRSGGCCAYKMTEPRICLSFRLTWMNSVLTLFEMLGLMAISETFINQSRSFLSFVYGLFVLINVPIFAAAVICLLFIQFLDKCECCCCGCFEENCLPMTEKTNLDTEKPLSY